MKDRIVLITGATRGLGLMIAKAFAKAGAKVAMNYANSHVNACQALAEVQEWGEADIFRADVLTQEGVLKLVEGVENKFGAIDTLVINATPSQREYKIEDYSDEDFDSMYKAFVMSPHYLTKALMGSMKQNHFGRIINITSEVFYLGNSHFSAYVAAKGAQIGYLRSTAKELAEHGITVNGVAPGWIPVERHDDVSDDAKQEYLKSVPMKRFGTPADIAEAVLYFSSLGASFVTGQTLIVNGGRSLN